MSWPPCWQIWFYPSSWASLKGLRDMKSRKEIYLGFSCFSFPGILLCLGDSSLLSLGTLFRLVQLKSNLFYTRWALWPWSHQSLYSFRSQWWFRERMLHVEAIRDLARTFLQSYWEKDLTFSFLLLLINSCKTWSWQSQWPIFSTGMGEGLLGRKPPQRWAEQRDGGWRERGMTGILNISLPLTLF